MIKPHNYFARAIFAPALIFAGAMALPGPTANAKGAADYYKGKTLTFIVSTGTGGGADYYGRLVTHHMKPFLAGTTIIVRNVPGAGHIIGANKIYHSKPNGLTIGTFTTGLTYAQIVQRRAVKYDLRKMSWLGKADTDIRVMFMSAKSPYRSFEEMVKAKRTIRFGTSGVGSGPHNEAHMIANTFGVPIQVLPGYSGNERVLGMLRGEIDGHVLGLSSTEAIMVKHAGKIVLQFGDVLPNVPKARDVAKTKVAKAVVELMSRQSTISRFVAGPPKIVPDRLALLRSVYKQALESPGLRADAKKAHRTINPAYGEDVARMVEAIVNQPPEIVTLLKKITNMKVAMLKHKGKVTEVQPKGRGIVIDHKGTAFKAKLSGSRTTVTVDGKGAKRTKIKVGMTCQITWPRANGEAKQVDCTK